MGSNRKQTQDINRSGQLVATAHVFGHARSVRYKGTPGDGVKRSLRRITSPGWRKSQFFSEKCNLVHPRCCTCASSVHPRCILGASSVHPPCTFPGMGNPLTWEIAYG
eukprot:gene10915-biopygen4816